MPLFTGLELFTLLAMARFRTSWLLLAWATFAILSKQEVSQMWMTPQSRLSLHDWLWALASAALLVQSVAILAGRRMVAALWLLVVGVSTLFWLDALYLRYFDDVTGLYLLERWRQAPAAWESAWRLRESHDILLLADLWVPFLFLPGDKLYLTKRKGLLCLAILFLVQPLAFLTLTLKQQRLLRIRLHNLDIVAEIGLLNYHVYDVQQVVRRRLTNLIDRDYDRDFLAQVIGESRRSMAETCTRYGKRRNLIVVQLESLQAFPLQLKVAGQEVMPFMHKLREVCLWGGLQDQTGQGRSSDGEFIYNNSLLPPGERPLVFAHPGNRYFGLPALLEQAGFYTLYAVPYSGLFWNCKSMSERYGFRHHLLQQDFEPAEAGETMGWGLKDGAILKRLIPRFQALPQPFYAYVVTVMSHHPYAEVEPGKEPLRLPSRLNGTILRDYLNCCRIRDNEVQKIVRDLKKSGLWDSSVVVFMGDHDARVPIQDMVLLAESGLVEAALAGNRRYDVIDRMVDDQAACLIHCPGDLPKGPLPGDAAQIDLAPTLLSLVGVPGIDSCFLGRSLVQTERRPRGQISSAGYSLDTRYAVNQEEGEYRAYDRRTHLPLRQSCPLSAETARWVDAAADLLRLDLVPTLRRQKF